MELNKKDSKMLQGLSVIAMLCLHLFCTLDTDGLFKPLLYIRGIPFIFGIGQISDFCVMGFAFCSGYAHYKLYTAQTPKKYYSGRLKSLLWLYVNFWLVCLLFSAVGIARGSGAVIPGSWKLLLLNMSSVYMTYNGAWWYLFTYAILVLLSPLVLRVCKKQNRVVILLVGGMFYVSAYLVRFRVQEYNYFLDQYGLFGMTFFEYLLGVVFCKYAVITKIYDRIVSKIPRWLWIVANILCCAVVYTVRTFFVRSLFVAPLTGMYFLLAFHYWKKPKWIVWFFSFTGKHATNIWLVHMFYYEIFFRDLVYGARYPILILAVLYGASVLTSMLIQLLLQAIRYLTDLAAKKRLSAVEKN